MRRPSVRASQTTRIFLHHKSSFSKGYRRIDLLSAVKRISFTYNKARLKWTDACGVTDSELLVDLAVPREMSILTARLALFFYPDEDIDRYPFALPMREPFCIKPDSAYWSFRFSVPMVKPSPPPESRPLCFTLLFVVVLFILFRRYALKIQGLVWISGSIIRGYYTSP